MALRIGHDVPVSLTSKNEMGERSSVPFFFRSQADVEIPIHEKPESISPGELSSIGIVSVSDCDIQVDHFSILVTFQLLPCSGGAEANLILYPEWGPWISM